MLEDQYCAQLLVGLEATIWVEELKILIYYSMPPPMSFAQLLDPDGDEKQAGMDWAHNLDTALKIVE